MKLALRNSLQSAKQKKNHKRSSLRTGGAVVLVIIVAIGGVYLIMYARAASSYGSIGTSKGVLSAPAKLQTGSTAYDNQYVQFGSLDAGAGSTVPAPPTVSSDSLYPLQHVETFNTDTIPSNVQEYSNGVLSPKGYISKSHIIPITTGLDELGYPDPISGTVGGVTGAGFDLSGMSVATSGGFDVCFAMSAGDWQNVHLIIISWPADGTWNEGENDIFEGNPTDLSINLHEIGSTPSKLYHHFSWPSSLASGVHVLSTRWDPVNGYRYYLDGSLVATEPVGVTDSSGNVVQTPTTAHHLTMQMQDTNEASTSSEYATLYWAASYGYSP